VKIKASIENNPKLRKAAEDVKKAGLKISDGITEAVKQFEESVVMKNVCNHSESR
jgi:import inner membrane translocase subunit TIM44